MRISHLALILTLAAIGLVDAAYLSYSRLTKDPLSCNILEGCDVVALSPYTLLFGVVPLSYLGFFFYFLTLVLALLYTRGATEARFRTLVAVGTLGFLFSLYFLYIQAFVIQAFCVYCVLSAAVASGIFLTLIHWWMKRHGSEQRAA